MRDLLSTSGAINIYGASSAQFYRDIQEYGPPPRIRVGRGFVYTPSEVAAWAASLPRNRAA